MSALIESVRFVHGVRTGHQSPCIVRASSYRTVQSHTKWQIEYVYERTHIRVRGWWTRASRWPIIPFFRRRRTIVPHQEQLFISCIQHGLVVWPRKFPIGLTGGTVDDQRLIM